MIICCGEALIDMIPTTDGSRAHSLRPHVGGAIFNTAIALGRLGAQSSFVSGISTDLFGQLLLDELYQSQVATDLVVLSGRPTTLAFVELTEGHASYVFYDENTAGRMLNPQELPAIPDQANAMYFGGISLINEPAADFYTALATREAGRRVIVADPNIRADFVTDEPKYRARLDSLIASVDILKVSDEDLDWIIPGPQSSLDKAREMRGRGPDIVVLTRGGAGASAVFGNDELVEITAPKVDVVDTVGAGDTFNAGLLAKLADDDLLHLSRIKQLNGNDLKRALEHGAKVAAITVSRAGANAPWKHELEQ